MKDKLKPCPFCGGEAEVKTNYEYGKARGAFVFCIKCDMTSRIYSTRQYAIKVWNRRVENER